MILSYYLKKTNTDQEVIKKDNNRYDMLKISVEDTYNVI